MKSINVVAAVIRKDSKFLIAKRNRNKHLGLKWEFPGGKVEDSESFIEALSREIKEELNIEIQVHKKIAKEKYRDTKIDIVLHYYLCTQKKGNIQLNEHEDVAWIEKKDLIKYDFAEGDKEILSLL